jgi:signal transduction histidine kinase
MDVYHDFSRQSGLDPTLQALKESERMLACWQQALGHELPNQMVAILGLARVLEETQAAVLDAEGRACLERLTAAAQRSGRLLNTLAEIGRLCRDARGQERVSLPEVAREAAAEVHLLCNQAVIEYDFQADLPLLAVSRRALHQVLVHLLRNAAQAALSTRPLRIQVGGRCRPAGVEFWVADNGRGLSGVRPEKLFEAFTTRGGSGGGQGLGLFLVRQLAAAWRGALRMHSEPGEGTTFTLLVGDPQGAGGPRS